MISLRILLIEDSELDAGLILRQLHDAGYSSFSKRIEDADQLRKALKEPWDIIIADNKLPDFNATEALAIVRDSEKDIPFVIVSGAIGEETAVSLMKSGARDYVMKDKLSRLPPVIERELAEAKNRQSQKLGHAALLESEINLKNSQKIAHVAHWVSDYSTGLITWSDEMYRILGLDAATVSGNLREAWVSMIHPEDRKRLLAYLDPEHFQNLDIELEYRILRPDGTIRYILSQMGESRYSESGELLQRSGVIHDITDRKLIELDLIEKIEESRKRAEELEAVTLISSKMRQAINRQELVVVILEELVKILAADHATFAFLDKDSLSASYAFHDQEMIVIDRQEKITGQSRKALHRPSAYFVESNAESSLQDLPFWLYGNSIPPVSWIEYPVRVEEEIIGILYFGFNTPRVFMKEQRNLVEAVAEMAGNALKRMSAVFDLEAMVLLREKELESIYKVTSSASATLDIQKALQQALELTLEAVHARNGAIFLLDESYTELQMVASHRTSNISEDLFQDRWVREPLDRVIEQHKAAVVADVFKKSHPHDRVFSPEGRLSFIGLPMRTQDRVVGVLAVIYESEEQMVLQELTLLSFIADHLALVVENTRLYKKAERSAVLEERSRLSRELHDSVTQSLYSASLYSSGARRLFAQGKITEVDAYLGQIGELTQQALRDMRLLVYELRSPELKKDGLIGALQNRLDTVERRLNIEAEIVSPLVENLPERVEENLYRIAIESLNNSLKYAKATKILIQLDLVDGEIQFSICDNGIGFSREEGLASGGVGLATMRERTEQIGGRYSIQTAPEKGTMIEVRIPLPQIKEGA